MNDLACRGLPPGVAVSPNPIVCHEKQKFGAKRTKCSRMAAAPNQSDEDEREGWHGSEKRP